MSPIAEPSPTLNPTLDGEHRVQAGLINALCDAVAAGKSADEVGLILKQLVDYSEVHFVSEELLMRLDSYDEFQEHVEDHVRMMDALQEMMRSHALGRSDLLPQLARANLDFLLAHIDTRDRRYANWTRI